MLRVALIGVVSVVVVWAIFAAWLFLRRPDDASLSQTARLLPDTLRLVSRLARDRAISRWTRLPVWLLLTYVASPIDLIPDFVPVVGYADDAILVSVVLRRLIRRAGEAKLTEHWPGSVEGLDSLRRVLRIES
jgi:uncharacterized membrane protein YkvA (DUF1232 family)